MLKMSSISLYMLSQPLSKTRDSSDLREIVLYLIKCVFHSELVSGFGRSFRKSFSYIASRACTCISRRFTLGESAGCYTCSVVCWQFACRHCWVSNTCSVRRAHASRWICRSLWKLQFWGLQLTLEADINK